MPERRASQSLGLALCDSVPRLGPTYARARTAVNGGAAAKPHLPRKFVVIAVTGRPGAPILRLKFGALRPMTAGMDPDRRDDPHAEPHRLWWRPGDGHGRGILFDSGHVHTWPEAEGEHRHMAGLRTERPVLFFLIRPDGRVRIPRRHAAAAAELTSALRSADGRLQPFDPHVTVVSGPAVAGA